MATKQHAKASFSIFENATKKLQLSEADLSEAIGYSRNVSCNWKNDGLIPKVAALAIECMMRRNNFNSEDHSTLVVKAKNNKLVSVKSVLDALECSFVEV